MQKEKRFSGSIKRKLIMIILLISTLTAIVWYGGFIYWFTNNQYEKSMTLSKTVAHALSQNIAKLVLLNEVSVAADVSSQLASFKNIRSMVLYKRDGTPIYQYSKDGKSFTVVPLEIKNMKTQRHGDVMRIYVDADYMQNPLGFVGLNIEVESILELIKEQIVMIVFGFALMLILSYVLAQFYARQFTQPILKLVKFLEHVESLAFIKNRIQTQEDNEFGKLYCEVNTMLERMEASYHAQKLAAVAFETMSGMTITNSDQKILQVNKAFSKITGYKPSEVIGMTPGILKSGMQGELFYKEMMSTLHRDNYWCGEIYNRAKDGTIFPQHLTIQVVRNDEDKIMYYVASFVDLTLQKKTEAKLQYLKEYDVLTGLLNRELFLEELQKEIDRCQSKVWSGLVSFNIKDFKLINDAYGHVVGDRVLIEVAKRLKSNFQEAKLVGRVSGDQYIIWFGNLHDDKSSASIKMQELSQEILLIMQETIMIDGRSINININIGIALCNAGTKSALIFLKEADSALHTAQKREKSIGFFDEQADKTALSHIDLYRQLLNAMENGEFELYYQLQYNLKGEAYAAEALIRWHHPEHGTISPLEFIGILEKSGLIIKVGAWIIQEVCCQLALWGHDKKTEKLSVAINISAKQFNEDEFIPMFKNIVEKNGISYDHIKLELTESLLINSMQEVIAKMQELKDLGVKISLDDFGTGYSSLEYLKRLPLHQIKIDMSFVVNMLEDRRDVAIVKSIIVLGEALGLEVIAEGVESQAHYELLKELGCHYYQGYYFARPEPVKRLSL